MEFAEPSNLLETRRGKGLSALYPVFPQQLPDETLYSLVTRFHMLNGRPRVGRTLSLLFGTPIYLSLHTFLPNKIGYFVDWLAGATIGHSLDAIEHFTSLPYFRPFLRKSLYARAHRELVVGNNSSSIRSRLGLHRFHSSIPTFRYCSDCRNQDLLMYGVPYWRRLHQLPMVHVCHLHDRLLTTIPIRTYNHESGRCGLDLPPAGHSSTLDVHPTCADTQYPIYKRFAEDMCATLHLSNTRRAVPQLIYSQRCRELGYIRGRTVAQSKLARNLVDHYGAAVFAEAGYDVNWLTRSLLKHIRPDSPREINNPAAHLIMIGFLFNSFNEFINYSAPDFNSDDESTGSSNAKREPRKLLTTRETARRAVRLVKGGLTVAGASKRVRCSPESVMLLASTMGIVPKPKWVRLCIESKSLRAAIVSADPLYLIARRFGLCLEYVNALLVIDTRLSAKRKAYIKERVRSQ